MGIALTGGGMGGGVSVVPSNVRPASSSGGGADPLHDLSGFQADWNVAAMSQTDDTDLTQITDAGSNAYHATATSAAPNRAHYRSAAGGYAEFDGFAAQYDIPAAVRSAISSAGAATLYMVVRGLSGAASRTAGDLIQFGSAAAGSQGLYPLNSQLYSAFCSTGQSNALNWVSPTSYDITADHVMTYRHDGTNLVRYYNRTQMASQVINFGLATTLRLGGNYNSTHYTEAEIVRWVLYAADHDATARGAAWDELGVA